MNATKKYEIFTTGRGRAIRCLNCMTTSYHPKDIEFRYCGACHKFHDDASATPRDCLSLSPIRVVQHVPGFIDGIDSLNATVWSLAELLDLPWVRRWTEARDFVRWEQCRVENEREKYAYLIARNQQSHWVVAYVHTDQLLELPDWEKPA